MTEENTSQGKASKSAAKQQAEEKRKAQVRTSLGEAASALAKLESRLNSAQARSANHSVLSSHLDGLYAEIDKLAKGRSIVEATTLIVDQVNGVVRDAKALVKGDVYVDRVKEFVPAGNNPTYPDILVVARIIREGLARFSESAQHEENRWREARKKAWTIEAVLEFALESGTYPTKDDIKEVLSDDAMADSLFRWDSSAGRVFDERLVDFDDLEAFLLGDSSSDDEAE